MSNKLLDKLGLTSLITKITNTFAKKSDLNIFATKTALDNKQDKITFVDYFPFSFSTNTKLISMTTLNTYLNQIKLVNEIEVSQNKDKGYFSLGTKSYPSTSSGTITTKEDFVVVFGKLEKVITKNDWDNNSYSSGDYNNFAFTLKPNTELFLVGLSVSQVYDANISSSPIKIVPVEGQTGGKNNVRGFYAIHDTSDEVEGYYIGLLSIVNEVTT